MDLGLKCAVIVDLGFWFGGVSVACSLVYC